LAHQVNRRTLLKTVPAAAVVSVLGPRSLDVSAQETVKVAFVYVGPIGDMGWTYAHDQGRLDLDQGLPERRDQLRREHPREPGRRRARDPRLRPEGQPGHLHDLVRLHGPDLKVARLPETTFVHISGYKTAENVGTAFGKIEEPRYVSGQIARR
jgi:basic membrane lipoprotein Med (substrate-binding protein (PBP1-ABC) superfamily)